LGMLDKVHESYRTDQQRVYLSGLSYGGFGTWFMASRHPEKFAAIAPVVGWGHPDLMPPIAAAGLPVWLFAAGRDTAVRKPYFYAGINKREQLSAAEVRFTVHEDMPHEAWRRISAGAALYNWVFSHSLPPCHGCSGSLPCAGGLPTVERHPPLLTAFRMFLRNHFQNVVNLFHVHAHRLGRFAAGTGLYGFDDGVVLGNDPLVLTTDMQAQIADPIHVRFFCFYQCGHSCVVGKICESLMKFVVP